MGQQPSPESWLTPELAQELTWPGVDLRACILLGSGVVHAYDDEDAKLAYLYEGEVDGKKEEISVSVNWLEVTCSPPVDDVNPIVHGDLVWHVKQPETGEYALLRKTIMSVPQP